MALVAADSVHCRPASMRWSARRPAREGVDFVSVTCEEEFPAGAVLAPCDTRGSLQADALVDRVVRPEPSFAGPILGAREFQQF